MEIKNIENILNNFKSKKVAVIGDLMLDRYIFGDVDRISPEAPVPVLNIKSKSHVMGGAANVINNIWNLGAKVVCFGIIGEDSNGKKLKDEMLKRDIEIEGLIIDKERPTIVKERIIAQNQQLLRLDAEKKEKINDFLADEMIEIFRKLIDEIDGVVFSDYNKGVLTKKVTSEIIKIANKHNKFLVVDPKPINIENYKNANSMTPNFKETLQCLDKEEFSSEKDFIKSVKSLKDNLNLNNILVTRSENGMTIFDKEKIENIPTVAKEVYDVTGAGDTVISAYILSILAGASTFDAAKIANLAAGLVVGRIGTSVVSTEEILEHYKEIRGLL